MATAVLPSVVQRAQDTVKELFKFIKLQGDGDYIGEAVSQLEHSLQAAHLAVNAGADDETVLGALLHDIGRFIPAAEKMPPMIAADGTFVGHGSHEVLGERYLKQLGFSDKVCQLVGAHVMAKRYLATDKDYYDALSPSSKTTLKYQGGIFNEMQRKEAEKDPYLQDKLRVRRWDDLAKEPNMKTLPLQHYEQMAVNCLLDASSTIVVHGRTFRIPTRPTVVVCIDGFDPEYLQHGVSHGSLPNLAAMMQSGWSTIADCAMPSFTNPNNVSIITGAPTCKHGIAGNFFLDMESGEEAMIQDDSLLRGTTILEQMARRGVRVAAVTAKDKLRKILAHGISPQNGAVCFSAEKAGTCSEAEHGISRVEEWLGRPAPPQYSGDLSLFVLDAGVKLLEEDRADLFYLTLSDFIQHHHAPGAKESDDFMTAIDDRLGRLTGLGAVVVVTGDHGMSEKTDQHGEPNVLFLEDALSKKYGQRSARVICPITDPFVRHHGALGSFVRVHLKSHTQNLDSMMAYCRSLEQVEVVLDGKTAAERFEMPLDREGDIVVIAKKNAVIGGCKDEHDLSALAGHKLRSHGGLSEQEVPLISSVPFTEQRPGRKWRNFDAFDVALNYQQDI